ncbi:MAG TPA: Acb2/Tad1 domain-containing protein [Candidatus Wunengus sp. YC60]|uniref:Acb2/Tad1 domain-containing protein n=1 Tax=Candidatus Wunengus sp. YC60 TaxID=3367697 RepID=UPI004027C845
MENDNGKGPEAKLAPSPELKPEPTFGQKAVGISFNPSADSKVDRAKQHYANIIDMANEFRNSEGATAEQKRLASIAITEAQGAQMWLVKALTWKD